MVPFHGQDRGRPRTESDHREAGYTPRPVPDPIPTAGKTSDSGPAWQRYSSRGHETRTDSKRLKARLDDAWWNSDRSFGVKRNRWLILFLVSSRFFAFLAISN